MTAVEQGRELGLAADGPTQAAPVLLPGGGAAVPPRRTWSFLPQARLGAAVVGVGALYALGALLPFWFLSSPELLSGDQSERHHDDHGPAALPAGRTEAPRVPAGVFSITPPRYAAGRGPGQGAMMPG